jgi:GGDEF domain-containing protein
MFRITNIEEINEQASRQIGNDIITEISNIVKTKMSNQYIFVRYMGPKFVIVFSGVEEGSVEEFLRELKEEVEGIEIVEETEAVEKTRIINGKEEKYVEEAQSISASPLINIVVSTYYKGTSLDGALKKIEEYVDNSNENTVSVI